MPNEPSTPERTEVEQLRIDLRRAQLRLDGARKQLDLRLAESAAPFARIAELEAELAGERSRRLAAEQELRSMLSTRTMRWLRGPRQVYSRVRVRVRPRSSG